MRIFKEHTNVLKKASGSWAEPYSLASLLALQRVLIYRRYIFKASSPYFTEKIVYLKVYR